MDEYTLHLIEDEISESWVEDWARHGVDEIGAYLAKHAAFLAFLDDQDA